MSGLSCSGSSPKWAVRAAWFIRYGCSVPKLRRALPLVRTHLAPPGLVRMSAKLHARPDERGLYVVDASVGGGVGVRVVEVRARLLDRVVHCPDARRNVVRASAVRAQEPLSPVEAIREGLQRTGVHIFD